MLTTNTGRPAAGRLSAGRPSVSLPPMVAPLPLSVLNVLLSRSSCPATDRGCDVAGSATSHPDEYLFAAGRCESRLVFCCRTQWESGGLFVLYYSPSLWASVWPRVVEMNKASRLARPVSLEQCKMPVTNGVGSVAPRSLLTADNRGQQVRDRLGSSAAARSKDGARFG